MSESLKLLFFGDFVSTDSTRLTVEDLIRDKIVQSDVSCCNFEAPIKGDYEAFDRQGPRVCQSIGGPSFLINLGFNVIQLANNHMLDFGEEGCKATIDSFGDVVTVGAGSFSEAYSIKVIEKKGIKIGFLSCVHHEFGVLESENDEDKIGTAWICHDKIYQLISEGKQKVDFLIVLTHAGVEEIDAPLPEWRDKYRFFIDCGADAVIGTHPHVPQGWESYKGKPIFYSLGNFYFDFLTGSHSYWNRSIVAELTINLDGTINVDVHNIRFDGNVISIDYSLEASKHNEYICDLLLNESKYNDYINKESLKLWYDYRNWLSRGLGTILFRQKPIDFLKSVFISLFRRRQKSLLENCLQCESHRWTILRVQKLIK